MRPHERWCLGCDAYVEAAPGEEPWCAGCRGEAEPEPDEADPDRDPDQVAASPGAGGGLVPGGAPSSPGALLHLDLPGRPPVEMCCGVAEWGDPLDDRGVAHGDPSCPLYRRPS
jgi:hypothetical protein